MLHKNIQLTTSNARKIQEFQRFGLNIDIAKGEDLPEVSSNINDVIIYKALHAGVGKLVEDTVLIVDDVEVVDIRWKIKDLAKNPNAKIFWITSLAVLDENGYIYIYRGEMRCGLVPELMDSTTEFNVPDDAFGFDPYLVPMVDRVPLNQSFYELDKKGKKDLFSPRRLAVEAVLTQDWIIRLRASSLPPWTGRYQNDMPTTP